MSELKTEHLVYMSDEMYTPIHYKGTVIPLNYALVQNKCYS